LAQSALEFSCAPEDFLRGETVITLSRANPKARRYLPLPLACDMVSYGHNVVAQVSEETKEIVTAYLKRYDPVHCFETPNLLVLEDALRPLGLRVCFMAEYFLPDVTAVKALPCDYELRILHQEDFAELYLPQWSNALCEKRKHLDVLGVGAYDDGELIGLAGCSADCEEMYQIGVDVLPEYRRKGIASAMTSRLALEILVLDKVPFYCAAWCNIKSVRNAIRSGFRPAWVEITAKDIAYVAEMNEV
jgi:GNAT superfamily N-acetyltransferase